MRSILVGAAVAALLLAARASAEEPSAEEPSAEEPIWREHPSHLSVVIAASDDDEETAFTLGLDYEYRVNQLLGLGFVVEHAFEGIDATTLLAVADVHIWRGLALQTGPGVEFVQGEGEEADEQEFAYRVGLLYEVELGRATFSPQVHYDFTTGEHSVVFGGALGFSF